ncbi:hypothetical protein N183_26700 [Sinorhizobium sp. Sb3]|nr:hypothetical protein N183_26700 [Sinorhizobium sp. Sb3]
MFSSVRENISPAIAAAAFLFNGLDRHRCRCVEVDHGGAALINDRSCVTMTSRKTALKIAHAEGNEVLRIK